MLKAACALETVLGWTRYEDRRLGSSQTHLSMTMLK